MPMKSLHKAMLNLELLSSKSLINVSNISISLKIIFFEHITYMQLQSFILGDCWKDIANQFTGSKHAKLQTLLKRLVEEQAAQAIDQCELPQPQANILLGWPWLWGQEHITSSPGFGSSHSCRPICQHEATPRVLCPALNLPIQEWH